MDNVYTPEGTIMTKVNTVGFFQELSHGDSDGPKLRDSLQQTSDKHETEIVGYLLSGKILIACFGIASDILNPSSEFKIAPHIMTDGVWAWPQDLAYYVKEYHVLLPDSFINHMIANQWCVPDITEEKLLTLEF
jgi:hypothetical protein